MKFYNDNVPLSVGTVTAMPVSIVVDFLINGRVSPFLVYLGMAFIAIGFIGFCISEFVAARKESAMEQRLAHHEAFLARHAVSSAHCDTWPDAGIHVDQATASGSSYIKPHPPSPTLLPTNYKEDESQPLLEMPARRKWKDSVIKYMF